MRNMLSALAVAAILGAANVAYAPKQPEPSSPSTC